MVILRKFVLVALAVPFGLLAADMVAAKKTKAADLGELIAYSDVKNCKLKAPFVDSLTALTSEFAGTAKLSKIKVEDRFSSYFGAPETMIDEGNVRAEIPMTGTWRGLPLHRLEVYQSEPGPALALQLKAPMQKVIAAMKRDGITFGPPNKELGGSRTGKEAPFYVSREEGQKGVTRLICSWE